jgi:antitoxin (DNA-binding transcriptional repressor) of toxin-antitoxin stability system
MDTTVVKQQWRWSCFIGCHGQKTLIASQFKARCPGLMDQLAATGEVLVITKNGQPVAKLHPCGPARRPNPFGLHPGVEIEGDVLAPIDVP